MSTGKKLPQYLATMSVCIGALGAGTALGWSSNLTDSLKEGKLNGLMMDDTDLGWASSAMPLGAMVMCFPIGFLVDGIGRKPAVMLTVFPFVIGWLLIMFAQNMIMVYLGRFLVGVAGGSFCVAAPVYTSEISQTELRGTLGTFFNLFLTIGILYADVFGHFAPMFVFNILMLAVPIAFIVTFVFMPESPVYLIRKGKSEKAQKAFAFLRGKDYDPGTEVAAINQQIAEDAKSANFWETMKTKASKKGLMICTMLMFFQQLSGAIPVLFFLKEIFNAAQSGIEAHWGAMIVGSMEVIFSLVSSAIIDRLGRRILLMMSCGLVAFAAFALAMFFTLKDRELIAKESVGSIGFIPLISLMLYIGAFCLGLGPIPWMAPSELMAPDIYATITAAVDTFNWFLAFLVTKFFLDVADTIGKDSTFYIFSGTMIVGFIFVLFFVPETKGKEFPEIKAALEGNA